MWFYGDFKLHCDFVIILYHNMVWLSDEKSALTMKHSNIILLFYLVKSEQLFSHWNTPGTTVLTMSHA